MSTINVLGPVGFNPTGPYDATRTYQKLDVVYYQGSSYVAISDSLGQLPTNADYWLCIAAGSLKQFVYDSVASMKSDNTLADGMTAQTLGYYEINDGGGATYKITDEESETEYQEELESGLYATLIIDDTINIKQLGAKDDGITDISNLLQKVINLLQSNKGGTIYVPIGRYYIGNTILINNGDVPIKILGNANGNYSENGSQIITDIQFLFKITNPSYNVTIENLYFINTSSRTNNTYCFSNVETNEELYTARWTFKNLGFRNFTNAIDFYTFANNNYSDGFLIENIKFSTVSRCMTFKHLEASKITNCYSEPFVEYFLSVYQSQGFSLEDSVIRGPISQDEDGCIGIILRGSPISKTAPVIRNCIFEDVDCAILNSMDNLKVINSRYTISFEPKINPVYIMNSNGVNPSNIKFENFIINYEGEFNTSKIYFTSGANNFTWKDLTYSYTTVTNCVLETEGYSDYTFTNLSIQNKRQWIKKDGTMIFGISQDNMRIFVGNNTTITNAQAPNGTNWQLGDIVLNPFISTGVNRHNHIIGWMYVETGYQTNNFIPIQIGIDLMTKSQASSMTGSYTGQQSYDTASNKPMWWTGSKWIYADGTDV